MSTIAVAPASTSADVLQAEAPGDLSLAVR